MILPRKGTELGLFRALIPSAPVANQRRARSRFGGLHVQGTPRNAPGAWDGTGLDGSRYQSGANEQQDPTPDCHGIQGCDAQHRGPCRKRQWQSQAETQQDADPGSAEAAPEHVGQRPSLLKSNPARSRARGARRAHGPRSFHCR